MRPPLGPQRRACKQPRRTEEDVWECDASERQIMKLDSTDVLTGERAGELLGLIKPLPAFDGSLLAVA